MRGDAESGMPNPVISARITQAPAKRATHTSGATQSPGPSTHSQHSPGLEDQISEVPFLPASARKRNVSIAMSNPGVHLVPSLTHAPRHDHGGHVVQLYTDDGFPIDVLSRFIGGALAVGGAAVVPATASPRGEVGRRRFAPGFEITKKSVQRGDTGRYAREK